MGVLIGHGLRQGLLGGIREKQRKLQEAHERTKTVTRTGEMKEIRERMQDDIEDVNKAARSVKLRLERLDKANEQSISRKARPLATFASVLGLRSAPAEVRWLL